MIDFDTYDVTRDVDEWEGHLCNSLNAEEGNLRHIGTKDAERLADYLRRAQAVIWYLRDTKGT